VNKKFSSKIWMKRSFIQGSGFPYTGAERRRCPYETQRFCKKALPKLFEK
jgi:hypothetical protein